ncbi:hypothetical protein ABFS83_04G135900 [Erythranthe nasuta]
MDEQEMAIVLKEKDDLNQEISNLRSQLKAEAQPQQLHLNDISKKSLSLLIAESTNRVKELEDRLKLTLSLQTESTNKVKELEDRLKESVILQTESANKVKELEDKLKEVEILQAESTNRVRQVEASLESKSEWWNKKEKFYHKFTEFQLGALRELKFASQSIHQEIVKTKKSYSEEFTTLGSRINALDDAAENYYSILAEDLKLHNELQELKGNIRVCCRIRPFLPGQKWKNSIVEYIGDNGDLIVSDPFKRGKQGFRSFKFDKVYSPEATQAEVFSDTQPLVQSVLDGYNVCIFAYGQTGSGKTYTMSGPDGATEEEWGVNYRALNNLFRISQSRESNFTYEISVHIMEIYNEQVRDLLLGSDGSGQRLKQPNGLDVPYASAYTVKSTSAVLELMDIGLKNRPKSWTAIKERSSRSHRVVLLYEAIFI